MKKNKEKLKFKINNFIGYRYRRWAVGVFILAAAWPFQAFSIFAIFPTWYAFLVSLAFAVSLTIPLAWLGGFLLHKGNMAFEEQNLQPLLGVVYPHTES